MAKSEAEIIEAHRTTIEAMTGKKCQITLIDKEALILKTKSLEEIQNAVEKINVSFPSILVKRRSEELVQLRKLFCLFASYGSNNNQIRKFLKISYDQVRYYLRHSKNELQTDNDFKKQFEQVKSILLSGN